MILILATYIRHRSPCILAAEYEQIHQPGGNGLHRKTLFESVLQGGCIHAIG
jgi:hypothetical protein